ncbi:MAG: toxin, partial [Mycobacterium sp.]
MIAPGDIAPRSDSEHELYVAVLSNAIHLAADTGRVITCPFIP